MSLANCSELVRDPVDAPPMRSPQAVHTELAKLFHSKSLVEIGTRHGDGMACFSRVAASSVAIEMNSRYCTELRRRITDPSFSVVCSAYQEGLPDADVYTWWQDTPHLANRCIIGHIRQRQLAGRVRMNATAAVVFDTRFGGDMSSWKGADGLQPLATWSTQVAFDERGLCSTSKTRPRSIPCRRALGAFIVATIPIARVPHDLFLSRAECGGAKAKTAAVRPVAWSTQPLTPLAPAAGRRLQGPSDGVKLCERREGCPGCMADWGGGPARVAHVILGLPFQRRILRPMERSNPGFNGERVANTSFRELGNGTYHLRMQLWALGVLPSRLSAILLVLPTDEERTLSPGYLDYENEARRLRAPLEVLRVANNSLGSYGMYLHAFASTRGRFDYYIFCEDDYLPLRAHFDSALVRMYRATFPTGSTEGVLCGLLQGKPVERRSSHALLLESSHIMSATALEALYTYIFQNISWKGTTTELILFMVGGAHHAAKGYYFGAIQAGFGKLLTKAGLPIREWLSAYRTPYWNHRGLLDYSGFASNFQVPPLRVLFAPWQWLVTSIRHCCGPMQLGQASCVWGRKGTPTIQCHAERNDPLDCCLSIASRMTNTTLHTAGSWIVDSETLLAERRALNVPQDAVDVLDARSRGSMLDAQCQLMQEGPELT